MAAIDWSSLGKITMPQGGVVATGRPGAPSPNPMDSLASGILQGAEAGEKIQGQAIQNQYNTIQLQNAQQSQKDSNYYRQAAQQGVNAVLDAHDKTGDVMFRMQYTKAQADIKDVLAETASRQADTKGKQAKVVQQTAIALGNIADAAHNADQKAPGQGTKVFNFLTSQLDEQTQQNLKQKGLGEWSPLTNTVFHATALQATADAMDEKNKKANPELFQLQAKRDTIAKKIQAGEATPEDKQDYQEINDQIKKNISNTNNKTTPSFMLSQEGQKEFYELRTNDRALENGMKTADTLTAQFKSIPQNAINPVTGKFYAKYSAQGEAINKNINVLVTQAPSILGLPANALRAATVWKMIQDSKPTATMWVPAAQAMLADIRYMGAIQAEKNWQAEAEHMKALSAQGNADEATQWFKDHPEPLKVIPKPDLEPLYKLFPQARSLNMEQDWDAVQKSGQGNQAGQPNPSNAQATPINTNANTNTNAYTPDQVQAMQNEAKRRGLIK